MSKDLKIENNGLLGRVKIRFQPGGIGRNISWLLFQSGMEAATMTVASLVAAHWFGPAALGQLALLLAGVQLVTLLGDGFFPTIIKYVSEAKAQNNPLAALIGWKLVWVGVAVLCVFALLMGLVSYYFFSTKLTVALMLLALILAIARGWRSVLDGCYRGMQEFRIPAFIGSICTSIMAGLIIGLALTGYRVFMYIAVMAVGMVINCSLLAWAYRKKFLRASENVAPATVSTSEFLMYSLPLALRGLATFLFLNINTFLLGGLSTLSNVGQFRLTNQFLTIPALILSSALAAVAPRIASAQLSGSHNFELFLSRVYGLMLLLTLPLALFFWFNKPLLHLFFPAYGPASDMLSYFAPAMAVMGLGYAASIVPVQAGRPGLAFGVSVVSGGINVVAAYVGLKLYGITGLAVATAIVHFCTYVGGIIVTHRAFHLRFRIRFS